jgi:hypothetical protein
MGAVLLIGMALFCIHFAGTSCWGLIHVAVASRMTASVGSIQNFASFICASFAPVVTGFIVDTTFIPPGADHLRMRHGPRGAGLYLPCAPAD